MVTKLQHIMLGPGITAIFVAVVGFSCIYALSQFVQLARWIRTRQSEQRPHIQRAAVWLVLAAIVTFQYDSYSTRVPEYTSDYSKYTSDYSLRFKLDSPWIGSLRTIRPELWSDTIASVIGAEPLAWKNLLGPDRLLPRDKAADLSVKIRPSTFEVERRQAFTLQAVRDFEKCFELTGEIKELGYKQEFTSAELLHGVRSEINPLKAGIFQLRFYCYGEAEMGSVPLAVAVRPKIAINFGHPTGPRTSIAFVLAAGKVVYGNDGFELPISIHSVLRAVDKKGTKDVPYLLEEATTFSVMDEKGNLQRPIGLTIPAGSSLSLPMTIPFSIQSDYTLVAFQKSARRQSNPLDLKWSTQGAKISLEVFPKALTVYASPLSSRSAKLFLESDGEKLSPSSALDVLVQAPLGVNSNPKDTIAISPKAPIGTYTVSGGGGSAILQAAFLEPSLGISSTLNIKVTSIRWFLVIALLTGLVGVVVGRGFDLFTERGLRLFLSFLAAAVAGWLLYLLLVMRWIHPSFIDESILDYVPAAFIGIIGGYMGLGIFKAAAGALNLTGSWFGKTPPASGGATPPTPGATAPPSSGAGAGKP